MSLRVESSVTSKLRAFQEPH